MKLAALVIALAAGLGAACTAPLTDAPCPCAIGYFCSTATQTCKPMGEGLPDASEPPDAILGWDANPRYDGAPRDSGYPDAAFNRDAAPEIDAGPEQADASTAE